MGNVFNMSNNNLRMVNEQAGVTYTIGGVKVEFPVRAYPSQISMMDKIIRGCQRAQNCLLESPTGSGKTLALLCGAIAWQKAEARRLDEVYFAEYREWQKRYEEWCRKRTDAQQEHLQDARRTLETSNAECDRSGAGNVQKPKPSAHASRIVFIECDSDEESDVFISCAKKMKIDSTVEASMRPVNPCLTNSNSETISVVETTEPKEVAGASSEGAIRNDKIHLNTMPKEPAKQRKPKIFFGTRTHKQLAQVVNELRRTAYNDVNSCVLSSRNHSCIHENIDNKSRNELCNELMDPKRGCKCRFYANVKKFSSVHSLDIPSVWDLEDLITFGKKKITCPYFLARELMTSADIIFCPYNYVIDPLIRQSMNISLKGNIVIVDEAHNIEDSCREAASFSIHQDDICDALKNCEELASLEPDYAEVFNGLANVFSSLSLWIDHNKKEIIELSDYDRGEMTMFGPQAVDSFNDYDFGPSKFEYFKGCYSAYNIGLPDRQVDTQVDSESGGAYKPETLSGATKSLIESLLLVLGYLYDSKYTADYQVVLSKEYISSNRPDRGGSSEWHDMRKKRKSVMHWRHTLNFWCLNPAAVFLEVKEKARSIVLTSGTLSPMESFQSELGTNFPIMLEANHVIDANQCWVSSLGFGPNNVLLDGKYASTNTYQFQDEIGEIVCQICSFVPSGILCFVPSYMLLEKFCERWSYTGTLARMAAHKQVMWEPRRGDQFEATISEFYSVIEATSQIRIGQGITGVLLIAVCRGKVSEGLDFADRNARVVITVGIPFPSIKDSQIMLKKSYNDQHRISKGLLGGSDWYQIQAYRALNQALGRCIRHRKDWGAILLIDNRFSNDFYYKSLSKWVRNKVRHHSRYQDMITQLTDFIQNRLQIEQEPDLT